jgi:Tol biopolymer transport system component
MRKQTALLLAAMAATVLSAGFLLAGPKPAEAAFPGTNGKIAFVSNRTTGTGVDNPTGDYEIFTMDPNGTELTQLTDNVVDDEDPAWSSDGQQIAFARNENGYFQIYKMDADGSNQVKLTNTLDGYSPTWSPDGTRIAFVSLRDGNENVYSMSSSDGSNQIRLTKKFASDSDPAWSPDGTKIAFTSERNGNFEIYVMKARPESKRNRPVNRSKNQRSDAYPNWSPDGTQIAFASTRDDDLHIGNFEIYKMNAAGTGKTRLISHSDVDWLPAWSSDGTKIVFESERDGPANVEIYVMNADGSGQTNITNNQAFDSDPDWQPIVN